MPVPARPGEARRQVGRTAEPRPGLAFARGCETCPGTDEAADIGEPVLELCRADELLEPLVVDEARRRRGRGRERRAPGAGVRLVEGLERRAYALDSTHHLTQHFLEAPAPDGHARSPA